MRGAGNLGRGVTFNFIFILRFGWGVALGLGLGSSEGVADIDRLSNERGRLEAGAWREEGGGGGA